MGVISLLIYGASGHGKVIYDVAERLGYKVEGFIDDDENKRFLLGKPVFRFSNLKDKKNIVLGIGDNRIRSKIYNKIKQNGHNIVSIIDKSAVVSEFATVGEGSVVFANCVINNSAVLGKGCIVNTGAIVEHDCVIGDFSHISPNAALAGGVKVGSFTQIGIGSCVRELIEVGSSVIVGAGTVVVKNIEDNAIMVGNPARFLKRNNE